LKLETINRATTYDERNEKLKKMTVDIELTRKRYSTVREFSASTISAQDLKFNCPNPSLDTNIL
jgi:hypothetical protein